MIKGNIQWKQLFYKCIPIGRYYAINIKLLKYLYFFTEIKII